LATRTRRESRAPGSVTDTPGRTPGSDARVEYEAMNLRIRDVIGAGVLACLLIGMVVLFVVGNIPAAK
jgi:hypothetical protein